MVSRSFLFRLAKEYENIEKEKSPLSRSCLKWLISGRGDTFCVIFDDFCLFRFHIS